MIRENWRKPQFWRWWWRRRVPREVRIIVGGLVLGAIVVGGYLAAHYSRQIDSRYVRWLVIVIGFGLAAMYFVKTYG